MTEQEATGTPAADAENELRPGEGQSGEESLTDAIAQAQASAQENWNKYLRATAELDNVRKRAARDLEQARKFAVERLAGELLEVVDSLERGVDAGAQTSAESLLEGSQATLRLLKSTLDKYGVTELSPAGGSFDPQLHEALSIQPGAGLPAGSVLAVIQKGYQLNGRLLRPARVIVAGGAPESVAGGDGNGDAGHGA